MKKAIVVICLIAVLGGTVTGCGKKAQDEYAETLKSGINKYNSGESMSKEEYNAVKNYKKWESKQGEKTYSEWENSK